MLRVALRMRCGFGGEHRTADLMYMLRSDPWRNMSLEFSFFFVTATNMMRCGPQPQVAGVAGRVFFILAKPN